MDFGCIICQDTFSSGGPCVVTKCGHIFHDNCITDWINKSRTCPSCRAFRNKADLFRVYFASVSDTSLAGALQTAEQRINSLLTHSDDLIQENKKLVANQKMLENNKNQRIRSLETKLAEANRRISDLEEAANPVNKHMQASWNMIVDDNDSLTKENKMMIAQQKVLENTQNKKIRTLENKLRNMSLEMKDIGSRLLTVTGPYMNQQANNMNRF